MTLYELENNEIDKSILWSITEDNRLDTEEFKTACNDLFKAKQQSKATVKKVNPPTFSKKKTTTGPKTKEEMLVQELESISPKKLLEDLSSGNNASQQDLKAINEVNEVMAKQGLPAPVMNVLIHYVLLQSNMKLSKSYLEKIASHAQILKQLEKR